MRLTQFFYSEISDSVTVASIQNREVSIIHNIMEE
jgi:hypothetical protein